MVLDNGQFRETAPYSESVIYPVGRINGNEGNQCIPGLGWGWSECGELSRRFMMGHKEAACVPVVGCKWAWMCLSHVSLNEENILHSVLGSSTGQGARPLN